MASNEDEALHEFVTERYPELRRSAFLMCGDWALAEEQTQKSLARLVAESRRGRVYDADAYVYSHLMTSFQRRKPRREHLFVAPAPAADDSAPVNAPAGGAGETGTREPSPEPAGGPEPAKAEVSDTPTVTGPAAGHQDQEAANPGEGSGTATGVGAGATPETAAGGAAAVPDEVDGSAADPVRTILVLDALHELSQRCRAVLILRHWEGFAVDETADMLGLSDERIDAYDAAGLAALDYLLHGSGAGTEAVAAR